MLHKLTWYYKRHPKTHNGKKLTRRQRKQGARDWFVYFKQIGC